MNRTFVKIIAIFWKDMLTELRTKEIIVSVLVFALLVMVIFSFPRQRISPFLKIVIRGVMAIQSGDNPRVVEQKLKTFLPFKLRGGDDRESRAA